jgi:hypothetical protein
VQLTPNQRIERLKWALTLLPLCSEAVHSIGARVRLFSALTDCDVALPAIREGMGSVADRILVALEEAEDDAATMLQAGVRRG